MAKKFKLEIKDVKVETSFDRDLGAEAEITGTYRGKPFLAYVQGGRDEDGNFERNNCPDCWTSISVDGKDAAFCGGDLDYSLDEVLGVDVGDDEDQYAEIWQAVEDFLTEHLGGERYWYGPGDPLDHFGHEAEIKSYEEALYLKREERKALEKKYPDRDEYLAVLEQKFDERRQSMPDPDEEDWY